MQDKLYFQPEDYGSGKKEYKEPKKKSEKKDHRILKLLGFLLFLLIIILIILWLLRGRTTVSGQYPENVKNEYLDCVSEEIDYAKLGNYDVTTKEKELEITATFKGGDTLTMISVKDKLTFFSNHDAVIAEARAHANFNFSLRGPGYDTNKFDNKFSIVGEKLIVNLTGKAGEIDEYAKDYFLIESDKIPETLAEYKDEYEAQGFTCTSSVNK